MRPTSILRSAPVLAGLALGAATLAGAQAAETVKIGFNAPLTGFAAADGKSALTGAELAVEQANADAAAEAA